MPFGSSKTKLSDMLVLSSILQQAGSGALKGKESQYALLTSAALSGNRFAFFMLMGPALQNTFKPNTVVAQTAAAAEQIGKAGLDRSKHKQNEEKT